MKEKKKKKQETTAVHCLLFDVTQMDLLPVGRISWSVAPQSGNPVVYGNKNNGGVLFEDGEPFWTQKGSRPTKEELVASTGA